MADLVTLSALSTAAWDETKPAGTRDVNLGDDDIREFKEQIRERLAVDHYLAASETGLSNLGAHKSVHLLVQTTPSSLADAGIIYSKDVSAKAELHYTDEDDNEIQLTKAGVINAFPYISFSAADNGKVVRIQSGVAAVTAVNRAVAFYYDGLLSTGTSKSATIRVPFAGTITRVDAYVDTAPTGANLICDVNLNGTTIWATQANRVTITAGSSSGSQTSFDTTAVAEGDLITLDIDQVGSTISGSDLSVIVVIKES